MTIIEAISRFLASFMEWFQQRQLMEAGKNEEKLRIAEKTIEAQEKINEIRHDAPLSDPQSILDKL